MEYRFRSPHEFRLNSAFAHNLTIDTDWPFDQLTHCWLANVMFRMSNNNTIRIKWWIQWVRQPVIWMWTQTQLKKTTVCAKNGWPSPKYSSSSWDSFIIAWHFFSSVWAVVFSFACRNIIKVHRIIDGDDVSGSDIAMPWSVFSLFSIFLCDSKHFILFFCLFQFVLDANISNNGK